MSIYQTAEEPPLNIPGIDFSAQHQLADQRTYEQFRRSGYHVARSIVNTALIDNLRQQAHDYLNATPQQTKKYQAYQNIEAIKELVSAQPFQNVLMSLIGPHIKLTLNRHNHVAINQPGHAEDRLHRDYGEWTRGVLSAAVYLDASASTNGATRIIPGSHEWYSPNRATSDGYWLADMPHSEYAHLEDQALAVEAMPGDVLFFDGMCFHGVGANTSTSTRLSVTLGFHAVDQLDRHHDETTTALVAGSPIYRGNDLYN